MRANTMLLLGTLMAAGTGAQAGGNPPAAAYEGEGPALKALVDEIYASWKSLRDVHDQAKEKYGDAEPPADELSVLIIDFKKKGAKVEKLVSRAVSAVRSGKGGAGAGHARILAAGADTRHAERHDYSNASAKMANYATPGSWEYGFQLGRQFQESASQAMDLLDYKKTAQIEQQIKNLAALQASRTETLKHLMAKKR